MRIRLAGRAGLRELAHRFLEADDVLLRVFEVIVLEEHLRRRPLLRVQSQDLRQEVAQRAVDSLRELELA